MSSVAFSLPCRSLRVGAAATAMAALLAGCGANKFSESSDGIPFFGTDAWQKIDQLPERSNALGVQAVNLAAPFGDQLHDPCAITLADGSTALYFTRDAANAIGRTHAAGDGFAWEPTGVVMRASEAWELGSVRGLSAIERADHFEAWYAGGDGAGIGRAVSVDGIRWTIEPRTPVLVATETWERGSVRAPAVAVAPDGRLWMAYEVGNGAALAIASSDDGLSWTRIGANSNGDVGAILEPGDPGAWDAARVAAPALAIERTAAGRTVFRLWFEGMADNDHSIGEAASYDGRTWTPSPYNPVLAESPPLGLTIGADEREPWVLGAAGARRLYFVTTQLDPPAQGLATAVDHSP